MKSIYEYLDYREYLKDFYEERKSSPEPYSYRTLGMEFGLDGGNAFRILQGNAHLPARCISHALEMLGLSGQTAEYFLILITCSRERNAKARKEILEKAKTIRVEARRNPPALAHRLQGTVAFENVPVMVEAAGYSNSLDDGIAKAFDLLLEQGLVKKGKSGKLVLSQPRLSALSSRIPAMAGAR